MRRMSVLSGLVILAVGPAPAVSQAAQSALGIVRQDASAYLYYEWTGTEWQQARWSSTGFGPSAEEPWVGTAVTFADTLGVLRSGELGRAFPGESGGVVYSLPASRDFRREGAWHRLAIGLVSTVDSGLSSFATRESVDPPEAWDRFVGRLEEAPDSGLVEVSANLWEATLRDKSVVYFQTSRRAKTERGDCYSGIISTDGGEPVVVTHAAGDCQSQGGTSREPIGLVERSGRLFVLVSTYGWEDDGAELWEIEGASLKQVRFGN